MAKGRVYELVDVEGCRVVHVPLSAWPALTGIVTDNQYQFDADCYRVLIEEVVNMACACKPESVAVLLQDTWNTPGVNVFDLDACPAGVNRRITHISFLQVSLGVVAITVKSVKNSVAVAVEYVASSASGVTRAANVDVWHVPGDFLRFDVYCQADNGTVWCGFWGEEWTI